MPKDNNLSEFLKGIANAIREKKHKDALINPQDFSEEIRNIKGGGNGASSDNDIRFFDYDGTLLYSFTLEEAKDLEELPELPVRKGLICQGWNWDLEDIKNLNYPMDIAAIYTTEDGKTRFYVDIPEYAPRTVDLRFSITRPNIISIDWGDGETYDFSGEKSISHTYSNGGTYIIEIESINGVGYNIIQASTTTTNNLRYCTKIEIGDNVTIKARAFGDANMTEKTITIPNGTILDGSLHFYSSLFRYLAFPKGVESISGNQNNTSLIGVSFPKSITTIGGFNGCTSLTKVRIPENVTYCESFQNAPIKEFICPKALETLPVLYTKTLTDITFNESLITIQGNALYSTLIKTIELPQTVTSVGAQAFKQILLLRSLIFSDNIETLPSQCCYGCVNLRYVKLPNNLKTIESTALDGCTTLNVIDCRGCVEVPNLKHVNGITNTEYLEIQVPEDLLVAWRSADNWSDYADKIVGYPRQ